MYQPFPFLFVIPVGRDFVRIARGITANVSGLITDPDGSKKRMSKRKRVHLEIKYIGWNYGSVRITRNETKGNIEILEIKIDGVDILDYLPSSLFKEKENSVLS